ncbi:MAG: helix-turn-helix domain-containing protein [Clostridia bacterium]|nr:helix-turn-helix domain-containing protein [Clostridia bacterium]
MTMEESLKAEILSRYKSVNDFASVIGVPQSTIASIFKRGIGKAGVQTVLKIFNALDLDVESIERGSLELKSSSSNVIKYEPAEIENIIKKYCSLDQSGQEAVQYTLNHEVKRVQTMQELEEQIAELQTDKNPPETYKLPFAARGGFEADIYETPEERESRREATLRDLENIPDSKLPD